MILAARRARDMRAALARKGFRHKEGHHLKYYLYVGAKRTKIGTKFSHGVSEYGDALLAQIARQLRLSRRECDALLDCPLDEEGYRRLMVERGHVRPS